jgi:hypothetical protein
MKGLVWGSTSIIAKEKLTEIEACYELLKIPIIKKRENRHSTEILFENGDIWKTATAHESARGHKVNISYVDRKIDPEFVDVVIKHCTTALPYNSITYYGEPHINN